jgi:hypothetical protein
MHPHLGSFAPGSTVYGMFNSRDTDGAPIALAGTPSLECYKNAADTPDNSGITLTEGFSSVTGLNHFAIDTSADPTFYAAGSEVFVVLAAGTADGVSVAGVIVAQFSLVADGLTTAQKADVLAQVVSALDTAGVDQSNGITRIAGVNIGEGGAAPGAPIGEV